MQMMDMILMNLERVGFGVGIFLATYLANMALGAWKNVKIEGYEFDAKLLAKSVVKFLVLGVGISLLSVAVSLIPAYATYIGIEIESEALNVLDNLVIISMFLTATIRYAKDGFDKLKTILGNS